MPNTVITGPRWLASIVVCCRHRL